MANNEDPRPSSDETPPLKPKKLAPLPDALVDFMKNTANRLRSKANGPLTLPSEVSLDESSPLSAPRNFTTDLTLGKLLTNRSDFEVYVEPNSPPESQRVIIIDRSLEGNTWLVVGRGTAEQRNYEGRIYFQFRGVVAKDRGF